ncbi:hypothetical protein LSG31_18860 [Fodinisporobacter ferrooxydans]|uniref:Uncharacterized protein n=1 Tax=Fodinisporobacter ferrooxydans TaxID=2901836 RepID=A0ABY4CHB6_9BACL|nr:hypothetical protein LSG31_18860 [Alicyclobacillaceae bacterium MYW30-H2]
MYSFSQWLPKLTLRNAVNAGSSTISVSPMFIFHLETMIAGKGKEFRSSSSGVDKEEWDE